MKALSALSSQSTYVTFCPGFREGAYPRACRCGACSSCGFQKKCPRRELRFPKQMLWAMVLDHVFGQCIRMYMGHWLPNIRMDHMKPTKPTHKLHREPSDRVPKVRFTFWSWFGVAVISFRLPGIDRFLFLVSPMFFLGNCGYWKFELGRDG